MAAAFGTPPTRLPASERVGRDRTQREMEMLGYGRSSVRFRYHHKGVISVCGRCGLPWGAVMNRIWDAGRDDIGKTKLSPVCSNLEEQVPISKPCSRGQVAAARGFQDVHCGVGELFASKLLGTFRC